MECGDIFPNETYFVNTAFRSKKLTEKEKSKLGAKNREVYLTKYIRGSDNNRVDEESAIQKMYELEVPYKALTFNKGTEEEITFPQSAMVTFICCNPSIEEKVAMQIRLALDQIASDKEVNVSDLDEKQMKMYDKAIGLTDEMDIERGVGNAR